MYHSHIRILAFACATASAQIGCAGSADSLGAGDEPGQTGSIGQVQDKLTSVSPGGSTGHNLQFNYCGTEGDTCNTHNRLVAYGAGTSFVYATFPGDFECTKAQFGADPKSGKTNSCYISQYTHLVDENQIGTATGSVAFGAKGKFNFLNFASPTQFACNDQTFGDPISGVPKACYVVGDYAFSVQENSPMLLYFAPVAFGANGHFNYAIASGNPFNCTLDNFGGAANDPAPGVVKGCYVLPGSFLASEGQTFTIPGSGGTPTVWFGGGDNGNFASYNTVSSGFCQNGFFGADPDVGTPKFCWGARL